MTSSYIVQHEDEILEDGDEESEADPEMLKSN